MKKIVFTIAFIAGIMCARGQESDAYNLTNTAMTFLTIPSDARSAGMGDMGIATGASNYAHQNNAAKYLFMDANRRGGVNIFYAPWLRNLVKDMSVAGVSGFYRIDDLQAASASFRYFSMGDLKFVDDNQAQTGSSSPYELALDLAYSRKLGHNYSMSVAMRYGASSIASGTNTYYNYKTAHVLAFDLTGYYKKDLFLFGMDSELGIGYGLKNIGMKVKYAEGRKFFLPAELKVGANLAANLDKHNGLSLGLEVGKYLVSSDPEDLDKSMFSGIGASFSDGGQFKELVWQVGMEYNYNKVVFLRAGYFYENEDRGNRQYLTFGAGLAYKVLHLDGSYLVTTSGTKNPLENTFRLSLSVDF
ncbi:type IX secretion system outer membrane channel protein PorV [Odoribacter sp. OttesenSCG-928-G04]|nr:type IX secretion system outer membrane channel protein PorV [Odoribacter sp. OttesenSCG-928-G04]